MVQGMNSIPQLNVSARRTDLIAGIIGTAALASILLLLQSPLLLFFFLAGLLTLISFLFWFEYIPLVLIVLLPFSVEMQITGGTRLTVPTEPLIIIVVLAFILRAVFQGKLKIRSSQLNIAVLLLYSVMVVSLGYTWQTESTLKAIIRDSGYILIGFYIIPLCIQTEKQLQHVCIAGLATHTAIVLYGFITQLMNGIRIYDKLAAPFFIEHCIYAAFITFSFAFILAYQLNQKPGRFHLLLSLASLLIGLAIGLTFVRAAWLSVVILLLFYMIQFYHKRSSVDLIIILMVLFIAAIVLMTVTDLGKLFMQRIETIGDTKYVSNHDRLDRWAAAWKMALDHIVYGVGWGAYPDVYPYYRVFENAFSSNIRMGAHNLYLEILAETGLIGISIFLYMIYVYFRQCILLQYRVKSEFLNVFVIALQGAMITYLFHAFLNNLGPSDKISIMFWFMLGMVPTVTYLVEKEDSQQEHSS